MLLNMGVCALESNGWYDRDLDRCMLIGRGVWDGAFEERMVYEGENMGYSLKKSFRMEK